MAETNQELQARHKKLGAIFMPYAASRHLALKERNGRLVHYTTAESALKIIKSESIWLRNARDMNDFSEVEHGFALMKESFLVNDKARRIRLYSTLSKIADQCGEDAIKKFDDWWTWTQTSTYLSCFSEHSNSEDEDAYGRLSMWRAFSRNQAAVAIVLRGLPVDGNVTISTSPFPQLLKHLR